MWSRITGWIIGFRTELMIGAVIFAIGFGSGFITHKTIVDAGKEHSEAKQLDKAKKAPGEVIKFNQQLRATDLDKDECANKLIPPAALQLLH